MTCEEAGLWILRFADGTIEGEGLARLKEHLNHCAACRDEADAQAFVKHILAARADTRLPEGHAVRLAARLNRERPRPWRRLPWRPLPGLPLPWLPFLNWRAWSIRLLPAAVALWVWAALTAHAPLRPRPADSRDILGWSIGGGTASWLTRTDISDGSLLKAMLYDSSPMRNRPDRKEQP